MIKYQEGSENPEIELSLWVAIVRGEFHGESEASITS